MNQSKDRLWLKAACVTWMTYVALTWSSVSATETSVGTVFGRQPAFLKIYEDPDLYSNLSGNHQKEAKYILETYFKSKIIWTDTGKEKVLDMGCGPGDVTRLVLLPFVESKISSIHGVDIDQKMIDLAKVKNANAKITYSAADVGSKTWSKYGIKPVDKLFSFFALQWVSDRSTLAKNIYNSLQPQGQAFLLVVARNGVYNVWDKVSKFEKWKKHLPDAPEHINEYVYSSDPEALFTDALKSAGLRVDYSNLVDRKDIFNAKDDSDQAMISAIRTVDPYVDKLPDNLKDEYLKDVLRVSKEDYGPKGAKDYTALIVKATRP